MLVTAWLPYLLESCCKVPEAAAVLHNDVLLFYQEWGVTVGAVLTDNGREFCGTPTHPFELYLALNTIQHRRTQVAHPDTNGFVERFHRTIKNASMKPWNPSTPTWIAG